MYANAKLVLTLEYVHSQTTLRPFRTAKIDWDWFFVEPFIKRTYYTTEHKRIRTICTYYSTYYQYVRINSEVTYLRIALFSRLLRWIPDTRVLGILRSPGYTP